MYGVIRVIYLSRANNLFGMLIIELTWTHLSIIALKS